MNQHHDAPGRPTLDPNGETTYVAIGSVAMTPTQAAAFEQLAKTLHGKANAIRYLIDAVATGEHRPNQKRRGAA